MVSAGEKKTNGVRRDGSKTVEIDGVDRKLLRLLAEDADRTYAALGAAVHLSAPAVHERVRRLKREGIILGTVAKLDGERIGCPLLSFLHVETEGRAPLRAINDFASFADVEEIHAVAGDPSVILKVRTRDTRDLEGVLARLYELEGVRSVKCYVVLSTHLERGPKPEIEI